MACFAKKVLIQGTYDRSLFHFLFLSDLPRLVFVGDGDQSVYDRAKPELNNRLSTGNLPTRAQLVVCSFCAPLHLGFANSRNLLFNRPIL